MKCTLLLVVSCLVMHTKALECGIAKVSSDKIKESLSACVKNNETLEKIWELATAAGTSSIESKEASDSASSEGNQSQSKNARKARETGRVQGRRIQVNERRTPDSASNSTETSSERSPETTTSNSMESTETCVAHCVFEHLGLTDDNGLPDHGKVVDGLLKTATGRELRVFMQESADDCFQQMDQENNLDSCTYTTKLVTCLADKGRTNCGDWPAGNLPF